MRSLFRSPLAHAVLLLLFAVFMVVVWRVPIQLAGQMYDVPPLTLARIYAETGTFALTDALGRFLPPDLIASQGVPAVVDGRMTMAIFAFASKWIAWTDLVTWTLVSAFALAAALIAWWLSVATVFSRRTAWISVVLLAFVPLYWRQAVWPNTYTFSFFFLFASFAAFALLYKKSFFGALVTSGIFFGLTIAAKDAFIMFFPWYGLMFLWAYHAQWKRAIAGAAVFCACAGAMYVVPYIQDIRTLGYPVNQNLARIWPGASEVEEGFYLHLYPDPYTYFFDRQRFDESILESLPQLSTLERLQKQKILLNFNVGKPSVFAVLGNGLWLFVGSFPSLLQQDTMGGIFLWLFVLPGMVVLWKKNRFLTVSLVGLFLSTEFLIRFVLHFARDHLMDTGWVFVLFAAIGIEAMSQGLARSWKKPSAAVLAACITLLVAAQLMQANRVRFARIYSHSVVPQTLAIANGIDQLPDNAVVATPLGANRVEQLAMLSSRTLVPFDSTTMEHLLQTNAFSAAMEKYGITHLLGFDDALNTHMLQADRDIRVVTTPTKTEPVQVTPFVRYLLHLLR